MRMLLKDEGLSDIEVIRVRGTAAGYRVKYRLKIRDERGKASERIEKAL